MRLSLKAGYKHLGVHDKKQDSYAVANINKEKQQTKAIDFESKT